MWVNRCSQRIGPGTGTPGGPFYELFYMMIISYFDGTGTRGGPWGSFYMMII